MLKANMGSIRMFKITAAIMMVGYFGSKIPSILEAASDRLETPVQLRVLRYENRVASNPGNVEYRLELIRLLNLSGDVERYRQVLSESVNMFPNDYKLVSLTGSMLSQSGKHKEAIPFIEKGLSRFSQDSHMWEQLGYAYLNTGNKKKTLLCLCRALMYSHYSDRDRKEQIHNSIASVLDSLLVQQTRRS